MLQLLAITKPSLLQSDVRNLGLAPGSVDKNMAYILTQPLWHNFRGKVCHGLLNAKVLPWLCDNRRGHHRFSGELWEASMAQDLSHFSHLVWPNGPLCNNTTNRDTACALLSAAKQVVQINTVGNTSTAGFQGLFTGNQFERSSWQT